MRGGAPRDDRVIRARLPYFMVSVVVLVVDQLSKIAADLWLRGRGPVILIPGLFDLHYSRNRGGLFGYFAGMDEPWRMVVLTVFPLLAVIAIATFLARTDEPVRTTLFGLGLILGGASGNLLDRALRGEVVDFLDVYASLPSLAGWLEERFGTAHWPTFNLADSSIVIGAGLLVLDVLRPERSKACTPTS